MSAPDNNNPISAAEPVTTPDVGHHEPTSKLTANNSLADLAPLNTNLSSPWSSSLLQTYLVLAVTANFSLLFLKGYSQDLGYWQDWVRQLSTSGYDGFNGNYPPLYVHWLYLVGKFYTLTGIPLEHNDFLKFLTQIPVTIFHCLLVLLVFSQLQRFNASRSFMHTMMLLTVLNPAILVNGPIWGQVDLIPAVMVFAAMLLAVDQRWSYLSIPIFALALLTKFQMIAFAPVFGFLFFRNTSKHLIGILLAIVLGAVVFLPSILAGHFWQAVKQAYIDTLGQYPMTTFNAANIWILLTGNTAPDNIVLFGIASDSALATIFTAKYFGMILFSLTALYIFLQGIHFLVKNNTNYNERQLLIHSFFSAMICAVAFFTLLPAMHERYLFPAVVLAIAYSAIAQQKLIYPIIICVLCALNMLIILEINGSDIWHGLSLLIVIVLVLAIAELIVGKKLFDALSKLISRATKTPFAAVIFTIIAIAGMLNYFFDRYQIHQLSLGENQQFLTELPLSYARQDHGKMALNRSYDGNHLSLANRRYAQGIGTHANSDIQYQLPSGATEFSFKVGLDDEVGTADVQFSVWGDGELLWESKPILGHERNLPTHTIKITGIEKLNLKVAALKDDKWDHANWVNTVISFTPKTADMHESIPVVSN
ncbi:MAG: NPCBM/NEW2 domain-containing protein [Cellvibrio sp.]|uniref:NPCBM/NEW2 domain-containing protein n=1 Tax=Cellvibrio sp. TaxID=1965322 RepID=UPI0031A63303